MGARTPVPRACGSPGSNLLIPGLPTYRAMGLRRQLEGVIPDELMPYVSDHYDVVGDIVVLALHPALGPYKVTIAQAVAAGRKNIYTVLNKTRDVAGQHRTAQYEVLFGHVTTTTYHEFGFSYRLDVTKTFFSPRMAYERKRVTDQVEPGERVCVPFAGVGPFAIPAAARGADVQATEINPDAFRWLSENIVLNRVRESCHPHPGDAFDTSQFHHGSFDRIIIPAPYGAGDALSPFLPLLSEGGMAHSYTFRTKEEIPALVETYEKSGLAVTFYTACGNVAPGVSRWVFDLAYPI